MVLIVLALGAAWTAAAHTGVVGLLRLDHFDTGGALSTLAGNLASPIVRFVNNGTGPAMNLQVQSDRPPLTVNSAAGTATNLSADELDGNDSTAFFPSKTYAKSTTSEGQEIVIGRRFLATYCDSGDKIISGGHYEMDAGTTLYGSTPDWFHQGWQVEWINDGTADSMTVTAYCADFGTPHTP